MKFCSKKKYTPQSHIQNNNKKSPQQPNRQTKEFRQTSCHGHAFKNMYMYLHYRIITIFIFNMKKLKQLFKIPKYGYF